DELNRKEDLAEVCRRLNDRYFDGKIEVRLIEYSADQLRRFGSCNSRAKTIRISHRLSDMPRWVRDYVVVHEMAHVPEPNHGPAFWRLVSRYELAERARGFLMAKNFEDTDESDVGPPAAL
ncbi:MAG: M48 family metallopeptidase, partial [Planctomycetota bacterium]|nr:M48 family metallopeptidase [Planctomycetota bacterium]